MLPPKEEKNRSYEDFDLISKWSTAEDGSSLFLLMSSADADLIEKELIEKWGIAGYEGAILLLMSRKTLKAQKAEVILRKWMHENNEKTFRSLIYDLNQHLDYLKIKLNFELNDVILSAKLKACSKLMLGIMESHKDILLAKYKQLVYKDDFGKIVLKDFDRELSFFCKNTLSKKYEYNNIITEFAYEILHRKFLDLVVNNNLATEKNQILRAAQQQLETHFDTELENFAKHLCMSHFRNILLKDDI